MSSKYDELIRFIPAIKDKDFGKWIIDHENDGSPEHPIHFPFVSYSACVRELEHAIYEFDEKNEKEGSDYLIDVSIVCKNGKTCFETTKSFVDPYNFKLIFKYIIAIFLYFGKKRGGLKGPPQKRRTLKLRPCEWLKQQP